MQTSHQDPTRQITQASVAPVSVADVPLREQLSALVDGELDASQWRDLSQAYAESDELRRAWAAYQCMGQALKGRRDASPVSSPDFVAGVMAQVRRETIQALPEAAPQMSRSAPAANDSVFRWKMVAGLASVVAVAAVIWQTIGGSAVPVGPKLAEAPAAVDAPSLQLVVTPTGSVMIRDAQLDELMAAHRQWGGMSALQMPAGFLRNATYENAQR